MVSNTNIKPIIYDSGTDTSTWNFHPDFEAQKVEDILEIVEKIE